MERRHRNRRPKWGIIIIAVILFAGLGVTGYLVFREFKITTINISGSDKYTYEELYQYIFENRNDKNVLLKLSNYISNYNFEIFIICVIILNQTRGIL